ncbi:immunity 26/phosphotriesterase HocA family protein [Listeria newyorkensis]|uniref:immunity 26/phosphotriesterase HocA family protein n=1 Tax=Listeria newyorkensis TaxID=1497681 RepID=UPI001357F769|nr:immunity 26/phosphotriesterase HocA family protein [Listeria newyorkensis]
MKLINSEKCLARSEKMLFELTNEQRSYLGLTLIEDSWDRVVFNEHITLFFDGDALCKQINVHENSYFETSLNENTSENRTILLPKTAKGKPKKLNFTALQNCRGVGVYFRYNGYVTIANFTTQTTFYNSFGNEEEGQSFDDLKLWLNQWMRDSTEKDLKQLNAFKSMKRQRKKYQAGDFFTFKLGRRKFGVGRILLVIDPIRKAVEKGILQEKHYGLHLMGKPIVIKVYNKVSDTENFDLDELATCPAFPSDFIADNVFYYGEYNVIGNRSLQPAELEFPISYSRSIDGQDPDTVYLQYGMIYLETNIKNYNRYLNEAIDAMHYSSNPYRFESIGFSILFRNRAELLGRKLDMADDKSDLRHPENAKIKQDIFTHFGLDATKSYAENYEIYLNK